MEVICVDFDRARSFANADAASKVTEDFSEMRQKKSLTFEKRSGIVRQTQ